MEKYTPRNEQEILSEKLARKVSLLMTKPENTDTKAPLLLLLKGSGLDAKGFRFTLTENMLKELYPNVQHSPELIQATNDHMLGKEVEVFLVTKDIENISEKSVVDQVVELAGEKTRPEDNHKGTLRNQLHGETKKISPHRVRGSHFERLVRTRIAAGLGRPRLGCAHS